MLTTEELRACFPAIQSNADVLLDNAGGSQIPRQVAKAIHDYMINTYVQLGADYETSRKSTSTVERAHDFINLFMNGTGIGQIILGSSTTVLCNMLADCYARAPLDKRDEIIVAETAHEANAGPWYRLADRGFKVHMWKFSDSECKLELEDLSALLSDRTRIVAFPHVSNVLGRIEDARAIVEMTHQAGARVVIDGVAYAPHRAIDVAHLKADWYVYSTYKVFGPHMSAMFGTHDAIEELKGPNHFFIPDDEVAYKFEPGGASHEGCAGLLGLWSYLATVCGKTEKSEPQREYIETAYSHFTELEHAISERILQYLRSRNDVRIIGSPQNGPTRVSTISFVHQKRHSKEIVLQVNDQKYGIRFGHFYAYRLCDRLAREGKLRDVEDGVIRISALHYNSMDEIEGLIDCLDKILS